MSDTISGFRLFYFSAYYHSAENNVFTGSLDFPCPYLPEIKAPLGDRVISLIPFLQYYLNTFVLSFALNHRNLLTILNVVAVQQNLLHFS